MTIVLSLAIVAATEAAEERPPSLTCYECAHKGDNNTCVPEYRREVTVLGFTHRCRVMEMDGAVVSQGVVPKQLCSQAALSKVNKNKKQLSLVGEGDVFPACCNSNKCNDNMCTAKGLPVNHVLCNTRIDRPEVTNNIGQPGNNGVGNQGQNTNNNNPGQYQTTTRKSQQLQQASLGGAALGSLAQRAGCAGIKSGLTTIMISSLITTLIYNK